MSEHEFDRDTAVAPRGDGEYDAELSPGWVVGGGVNGGYLLAVVANNPMRSPPGRGIIPFNGKDS